MGTAKPWFRIILTNVVSKQQWIDYVEIFCCIYTLLLQYKTKMVFALDPSKKIIKELWYNKIHFFFFFQNLFKFPFKQFLFNSSR